MTGTITEIATMVDMGGLIAVRATVANPPASLITGMSVRIFAEAQSAQNALILPLTAIHHDRGLAHVYVADGNVARRVPVELGIFDARYAQVLSGITADDQIIITWSARLADGAEINVVN